MILIIIIVFFLMTIESKGELIEVSQIDSKIEGNIIYLSGMAESFSINITNNQLYNYSWIINPKIQFYGTILLDIYMIYNGSKTNVANLSFSVDNDNNNNKNDRNKYK